MRGFSTALAVVLLVIAGMGLSALLYTWISSLTAVQREQAAPHVTALSIISAYAHDENVCVLLSNVGGIPAGTNGSILLLRSDIVIATRKVSYSSCGAEIEPNTVCTLCAEFNVPAGKYSVKFLLGSSETAAVEDVPVSPKPTWGTTLATLAAQPWPAEGRLPDHTSVLPSSFAGVPGSPVILSVTSSYLAPLPITAAPVSADVDGDGNYEVIVADEGNVYMFRGDFAAPVWVSHVCDANILGIAVGNLDPDANLEVAVTCGNGYVYGLDSGGKVLWNTYLGSCVGSPTILDLDGDGRSDVLVATAAGDICALSSSGVKEWCFKASAPVVSTPSVADVDGDGRLDIVAATSDGNVYVLSGKGSVEGVFYDKNIPIGRITLYDLNGDGIDELIYPTDANTINVREPDGTLFCSYSASSTPSAVSVGDVDGDESPEIVFSAGNTLYFISSTCTLEGTYSASAVLSAPSIAFNTLSSTGDVFVCDADNNVYDVYWYLSSPVLNGVLKSACSPLFAPVLTDVDGNGYVDIITALGTGVYQVSDLSIG